MKGAEGQQISKRVVSSTIEEPSAGQRLDVWLCKRFSYRSRNQWQEEIRSGVILVNGRPVRGSRLLRAGDEVSYHPTEEALAEPACNLAYELCHEDENMLVVNKPGNLPSHPAGRFFKNTLWTLLQERWPGSVVVNRLDRETSGLVLVAKTPAYASRLSGLFARGEVKKNYFVLVHGRFEGERRAAGFLGPCEGALVRKKRHFAEAAEESAAPGPEWEWAETRFASLGYSGGLSAVRAEPATGRLHQIRATLLALGFPLLGDKLYGLDEGFYLRFIDGSLTGQDRASLVLSRQALHAAGLSFKEPLSGRDFRFEIAPPEDMLSLWRACTGAQTEKGT